MITTTLGILVIVLGLICWLGQSLVVFAPDVAVRIGVGEPEEDIDRSMYLFERYSQGIPDILLTWLLPAASLMMLLDHQHWPILALIGGGVYLYFPSVFSITRIVLRRDGRKVGSPASQVTAWVFGALWTLSAIYMIVLAIAEIGRYTSKHSRPQDTGWLQYLLTLRSVLFLWRGTRPVRGNHRTSGSRRTNAMQLRGIRSSRRR